MDDFDDYSLDMEITDDALNNAAGACAVAKLVQALPGSEVPEDYVREETRVHTLSSLSREALMVIDNAIGVYGTKALPTPESMRALITNKLLLETEHPDSKVRLKALELLAKSADIGYFDKPSKDPNRGKTAEQLRDTLRRKLEAMKLPTPETAQSEEDDDGTTPAEFTEVSDE
jgi:hypothetical protein